MANSTPATTVIDMRREVAFNGYQISAGNTHGFEPRFWTLEVGRTVNGQIVWEKVSDIYSGKTFYAVGDFAADFGYYNLMYYSLRKFEGNAVFPLEPAAGVKSYQGPQFRTADFALSVNAPGSLTLTDHLEEVATLSGNGTVSLNGSTLVADSASAFTGTIAAGASGRFGGDATLNGTLQVGDAQAAAVTDTDAVGDDVVLDIGAAGKLALVKAAERIGGLSGSGTVDLGGDGILTLDGASTFTGTFANGGTVALAGGTFSGAAKASGDLTVSGAGGVWSGKLDVTGSLTLSGNLKFSAEGLAEGRHVLATFGSLGAGSAEAIAAAVVDPAPAKPLHAEVKCEGGQLVMDVFRRGLSVIIR